MLFCVCMVSNFVFLIYLVQGTLESLLSGHYPKTLSLTIGKTGFSHQALSAKLTQSTARNVRKLVVLQAGVRPQMSYCKKWGETLTPLPRSAVNYIFGVKHFINFSRRMLRTFKDNNPCALQVLFRCNNSIPPSPLIQRLNQL